MLSTKFHFFFGELIAIDSSVTYLWHHNDANAIFEKKIPWMEEPGRLQSKGSQRVGHD